MQTRPQTDNDLVGGKSTCGATFCSRPFGRPADADYPCGGVGLPVSLAVAQTGEVNNHQLRGVVLRRLALTAQPAASFAVELICLCSIMAQ